MTHNLDELANTLRDDRHRRAFAYWRSKVIEDRLPGRRDIDPLEMPDLLPWLTLIDVVWEQERLRLRCRLVGTGVAARFGRNITGLYAEEAYSEAYLAQVLETYSAIVESCRPHLSRHRIPIEGREHAEFDRLILPLAKDGDTIDMFLSCFAFDVGRSEWPGAAVPESTI